MIVIDTSAIVAILNREPESEAFMAAIVRDGEPVISALSIYEAMLVLSRSKGLGGATDVFEFVDSSNADVVPFNKANAEAAFRSYLRYGKGFHSKARLNLCDCAAYALAENLNVALLFKGDDFKNTPITSAA